MVISKDGKQYKAKLLLEATYTIEAECEGQVDKLGKKGGKA